MNKALVGNQLIIILIYIYNHIHNVRTRNFRKKIVEQKKLDSTCLFRLHLTLAYVNIGYREYKESWKKTKRKMNRPYVLFYIILRWNQEKRKKIWWKTTFVYSHGFRSGATPPLSLGTITAQPILITLQKKNSLFHLFSQFSATIESCGAGPRWHLSCAGFDRVFPV